MSWTFGKLDGLRSLDALASRYGKLPHELIPNFPSDDEYVVYCFNEAVAVAGLSIVGPMTSTITEATVSQVPSPTTGATIGISNGVPFISGKVPVQRKTT